MGSRRLRRGGVVASCGLAILLAVAVAPAGDLEGQDPDVYGLNTSMLYVSAEEFRCLDYHGGGHCPYHEIEDLFWGIGDNYRSIAAPVNLPVGALITGFRLFYFDDDIIYNMGISLSRGWQWGTNRGTESIEGYTTNGTPGVDEHWVEVDPEYTVHYRVWNLTRYRYQSFYLNVNLPPSTAVQLRGVGVYWKRQVRAAPAVATFNDVPTGHWAFQYIEALNASGITSGCGGGSFCPDSQLSRAEMAVFLAKALGLHYAP